MPSAGSGGWRVALVFGVAAFALAGIPPLSGFLGKLALFQASYASGTWVALGRASEGDPEVFTQGWEVPTSPEWPAGAYRVRIDVEDSEDRLASTQVPFTLEAEGESP